MGSALLTFARPAVPRARNGGLYRGIRTVMTVAGWLAALSLLTVLASARTDGVAGFPALEVRGTYELSNHGRSTPVSRTGYVLASASFGTGWHAMAVLANLAALRRRLYGVEPSGGPPCTPRRRGGRGYRLPADPQCQTYYECSIPSLR